MNNGDAETGTVPLRRTSYHGSGLDGNRVIEGDGDALGRIRADQPITGMRVDIHNPRRIGIRR